MLPDRTADSYIVNDDDQNPAQSQDEKYETVNFAPKPPPIKNHVTE